MWPRDKGSNGNCTHITVKIVHTKISKGLMKIEFSGQTSNPQISNFMTIPSLEAELFHADGRVDRQT